MTENLRFTKDDGPPVRAGNLSNTGALSYVCWHDQHEDVYVQIVDKFGGVGAGTGSYSKNLFRLSDIGDDRRTIAYDPVSGAGTTIGDNNMSGFLRAIKLDIFQKREEKLKAMNSKPL